MVTYGPWNESREFVEVHRAGAEVGTGSIEYETTGPHPSSGWGFEGSRVLGGRGVGPGESYILADASPNPFYNHERNSLAAWTEMVADVASWGPGGPPRLVYTGSLNGAFGGQQDAWLMVAWNNVLRYQGHQNVDWAAAVAPPASQWPADAWYIDLESPGHVNNFAQLLSVEVLSWQAQTADPWQLFLKDAGADNAGWTGGGDSTAMGWTGLQVGPPGSPAVPLDVAQMRAVVEANKATPTNPVTPEMPIVGIKWTGDWPGNFAGPDETYSLGDINVRVRIAYKGPRWRFAYDEAPTSVSYRRTSHRHDGLAGGATRNYPPSRALQTSNRIGGGYL